MRFLNLLAAISTVLTVIILDATGNPVANLPLRFQTEDGSTDLVCRTNPNGLCRFDVPATQPIVRGTLTVSAYGQRDVIWSGENMTLTLRLDTLAPDTESRPYDQPNRVAEANNRSWLWGLLLVLALLAVIAGQKR
ncbi:Ig-like domain-containing protein (plasmid) [Thermanaerothrix sp. 4228-RoL]|jgi:hypothetical protein|uniref:Ig-like domain-containing protein n=1 Tax=Thermanaerothrix solaris TaxID=3058434 RepID=A0ABU3NUP4_9CHLR|nr:MULTISPECIES: Ig-like domain-containing protein [unclassified Thermanaerothrix]MDT8899556.1 Ig-like domain-containing protein [Thermanaerothrix sp. 4228-RoL]